MMHQFPSVSAKLVAINSAVVALRETAAAEDDPVEQIKHIESSSNVEKEEQFFTKYSDTLMKPDIGILSKDFLKNKGRERPPVEQFEIHRKKRAAAADVDVGILSNK